MPPRGIKRVISVSSSCKLVGKGKRKHFKSTTGVRLRGLTRALEKNIWSSGTLPQAAICGPVRRSGWRGVGGGQRRGIAVDAQLSRIVNRGGTKPKSGQFSLTKLALAAMFHHGLEPVVCQRPLCDNRLRIATAADVICFEKSTSRLIIVELKCGYSGAKLAAACKEGVPCRMRGALKTAVDNTLNRHLTQLACTWELFFREKDTMASLGSLGIDTMNVGAFLLYVDDEETNLFTLPDWWKERSPFILRDAAKK